MPALRGERDDVPQAAGPVHAAGAEGLRNCGHTKRIKLLHDRIRELEPVLGRKLLEVELRRARLEELAAEFGERDMSR